MAAGPTTTTTSDRPTIVGPTTAPLLAHPPSLWRWRKEKGLEVDELGPLFLSKPRAMVKGKIEKGRKMNKVGKGETGDFASKWYKSKFINMYKRVLNTSGFLVGQKRFVVVAWQWGVWGRVLSSPSPYPILVYLPVTLPISNGDEKLNLIPVSDGFGYPRLRIE
ncbi:hypothetical protein MTR_2g041280 [Medicago truncatula]|uniref:Uncharacterized protein n=1 Tax=Medicago truncatula TaxID=3880 RepID=A0A072V663_MEDTR|nr:hypothetical protein MTR_2g041280 [Medicago truncatula]